ncbi:MAG: winged helix-turn-helix domain-containing protein, partial [Proteobacteria bacterium]|nr:winged helix-turn-helix domain-containing protein [Pseudomonadota bacterium]
MKEGPDVAHIAALIGDPARANMLTALMSGKALTVSELAEEAGVTIQTASSHLSKMDQGGLLRPRKQGRHKYFSLANEDVAHVLEGLMGLAAGSGHLRKRVGPKDAELRKARVCYNHLAGDMGTQLFDSLLAQNHIDTDGEDLSLTDTGGEFAVGFGIDLDALEHFPITLGHIRLRRSSFGIL